MTEAVLDVEIKRHLSNPNTYGYVFIGHGAKGGIINAYSHLGEDFSVVWPNRYTSHGIAFLILKACYSASKVQWVVKGRRPWQNNAWESNVAGRGWFVGYTGLVNTLNGLFMWVAIPGETIDRLSAKYEEYKNNKNCFI